MSGSVFSAQQQALHFQAHASGLLEPYPLDPVSHQAQDGGEIYDEPPLEHAASAVLPVASQTSDFLSGSSGSLVPCRDAEGDATSATPWARRMSRLKARKTSHVSSERQLTPIFLSEDFSPSAVSQPSVDFSSFEWVSSSENAQPRRSFAARGQWPQDAPAPRPVPMHQVFRGRPSSLPQVRPTAGAAPRPSVQPAVSAPFHLSRPMLGEQSFRPSLSGSSGSRRLTVSEYRLARAPLPPQGPFAYVAPTSKAAPLNRCTSIAPAPRPMSNPSGPADLGFRVPRAPHDGFVSHQAAEQRLLQVVRTLWLELCALVQAYSPVLQQLHASANMIALEEKFLQAWAPSTLLRYIKACIAFFTTMQQLYEVDFLLWTQVQIIDAVWAMHRSPGGPEFHPSNVIKALRWARKTLQLELPDLYGGLVLVLLAPQVKPHKESYPAPIRLLSYCELLLLESTGSLQDKCWAGAILLCAWGSLRWSDSQRLLWNTIEVCEDALRAECFRTKTTRRGMPLAVAAQAFHGATDGISRTWVAAWLAALASVWQCLRAAHDVACTPDCIWFTFDEYAASFSPLTYAQSLRILRDFSQRSGAASGETQMSLTLHSLKSSLLHLMHQQGVDKADRMAAGHHRHDSAALYSRDDTVGALRAQLVVAGAIRSGWLPTSPQRRGAKHSIPQLPLLQPQATLACFSIDAIWGVVHPPCNVTCRALDSVECLAPPECLMDAQAPTEVPSALAPSATVDDVPASTACLTSSESEQALELATTANFVQAEELDFLQGPSGITHVAVPSSWGIPHRGIFLRPACGTLGRQLRHVQFPDGSCKFCAHSACRKVLAASD